MVFGPLCRILVSLFIVWASHKPPGRDPPSGTPNPRWHIPFDPQMHTITIAFHLCTPKTPVATFAVFHSTHIRAAALTRYAP
ncbi:hypothetical protein FB45DRAFT_1064111, partial [Roridomyces roridus]